MDELKKCINLLDNNALATILNEIYDWLNTGILKDGLFKCLYNDYKEIVYITSLEGLIMHEAHRRFEKVVRVLIINNPGLYIK